MTLGIDGLASGLDTTAVIRSLMQIEAQPQARLKQQSADASKLVTAFQALNSKLAALATSAGDLTKASTWALHAVTSSNDGVTATAGTGAAVSSLDITVDAVAKSQVTLLRTTDLDTSGAQTLTLSVGGTDHQIAVAAGASLQDVAAAINQTTGLGVSATTVKVADGQFVLQLTGETGSANAFTLKNGAADLGQVAQNAADAKVTVFAGTALQQTVTSASNTFTGVLQGVDFTVSSAAVGQAVTLSVGSDVEGTTAQAKGLVDSLTAIFQDVSSRTATTTGKDGAGNTVVTGGLFTGETTIRFLDDNLRRAVSSPVGAVSPSTLGISFDRFGALSLDETKFATAMAADPEGTQTILATIAGRVATVSEEYSDTYDGLLTQRVKSEQGTVSRLDDQVAAWDKRLATREATLFRTFTAMEVALSRLQTQQQYMQQQLDSLNSSK